MMLYELDEIEKAALLPGRTGARQECVCHKFIRLHDGNCPVHGFVRKQAVDPRPGEKIQEFWCDECQGMHRGSVLGGLIHLNENAQYLQPTATQMYERTLADRCAWCGAEPHKDGCFCRRCPACGEYWKAVNRVDYSDGLPALKECPGCEGMML